MYCNVFSWLETPFGLLIGFINHLQVVTTINYNTVTHLQSLHANLLSLCVVVFTYSVSLNQTLQTELQLTQYVFKGRPLVFLRTPVSTRLEDCFGELTANWSECCCIRLETELLAPMVSRISPLHVPYGKRSPYCCKGVFTSDCLATVAALRWLMPSNEQ
jgi:hypothetical protein